MDGHLEVVMMCEDLAISYEPPVETLHCRKGTKEPSRQNKSAYPCQSLL